MPELDWDALARACEDLGQLEADERELALRRLEQSQPDLALEARSLLAADDASAADSWDTVRPAPPVSARTPAALPPVHRIGRYIVERTLGTGASATVYRARTAVPPRPVAIKLFHAAIGGGDPAHERAASRRFDAEVRALSRLRHPGIATILDAGSSTIEGAERRWIAMDLVEGGPITRWAAEASPDRATIVRAVADLAAAVAHAHARGIIHRDLKPANVLVEQRDGVPVVRVLDFGVARLLEDDEALTRVTVGGQVIGTVGYLAPEQVTGDPEAISTSVDIYAIGLILHELLSNAPALDVPTGPLVARLQSVARARPRPIRAAVPGISEDLAVIVETATAREIGDRYASAAALEQDLRSVLAGRPIAARPLSPVAMAARFVRRHMLATVIVVAASFILPAMLLTTMRSLARERASNARTTDALVQSLDIANEMADAMDRQYGSSDFLDTYYRRQLEQVEAIVPTVAAGTRITDPVLVDAVERLEPPDWRVVDERGQRVARLDPAERPADAPTFPAELRERYGDALLRFSSVLTAAGDDRRSLGLRLIGLALEREALARDPRDPERRRQHAFAKVLVGDALVHLGHPEIGEVLYQRALVADRELAAERPEVRRHLDDVAWGLDRLANLKRVDEPRAAQALYLERLELCEQLLEQMSPEVDGRAWGHALHGRASSASSLAHIAIALGDPRATEWKRRAERDYRTLALAFPEDAFYADRSRDATYGRVRDAWLASSLTAADADEVMGQVDELLDHAVLLAERAARWEAPRFQVARLHAFSATVAFSFERWERVEADLEAMRRWCTPRDGGDPDVAHLLGAWSRLLRDSVVWAGRVGGSGDGRRIVDLIEEELDQLASAAGAAGDAEVMRRHEDARSRVDQLRALLDGADAATASGTAADTATASSER